MEGEGVKEIEGSKIMSRIWGLGSQVDYDAT